MNGWQRADKLKICMKLFGYRGNRYENYGFIEKLKVSIYRQRLSINEALLIG